MSHHFEFTAVCPLENIEPEIGVCALVHGVQVALFRIGIDYYAVDNYDPFSKANVLSRGIVGDIAGDPVVASPIYKQHFRLTDGRCIEDESVQIAAHEVIMDSGMILVRLAPAAVERQTAA